MASRKQKELVIVPPPPALTPEQVEAKFANPKKWSEGSNTFAQERPWRSMWGNDGVEVRTHLDRVVARCPEMRDADAIADLANNDASAADEIQNGEDEREALQEELDEFKKDAAAEKKELEDQVDRLTTKVNRLESECDESHEKIVKLEERIRTGPEAVGLVAAREELEKVRGAFNMLLTWAKGGL
jgi:septal ring factor EnvC (AmiA/AmiB activator)